MTVYFIGNSMGEIKIGFTTRDPRSRLSDLQVGNHQSLSLLASCPGSYQDEKALHARFAAFRLHGEWFRENPELNQLVNGLRSTNKPRLPQSNTHKYSIEVSVTRFGYGKLKLLRERIKRLGYRSLTEWSSEVISREMDKLVASSDETFSKGVSASPTPAVVLKGHRQNLASIVDHRKSKRIDVGIYDEQAGRTPSRVVGLRRWRREGTGWIPTLVTVIFPDELMSVGKALRSAFDSMCQGHQ